MRFRNIMTAALAAFAAVSCVKDERDPQALIPEEKPAEPIDYSVLKLNELYGAAAADADKFIELFNTGSKDIDLENVTINKDEALAWTGSKGQVIKAGECFAIVGAKGTTADGFSSGFSAKKSVIVELIDPEGNVLDVFQRGEKGSGWGTQSLDAIEGSWSRIPDGTGGFKITAVVTVGAKNDKTGVDDPTLVTGGQVPEPAGPAVVLNELYGAAATDAEKFIELYNTTGKDISLKGYKLRKDDGECWTGADDLVIKANSVYAVIGAKGTTPDGFSSGFSAKKSVFVELVDPEGKVLDVFQRGEKGEGWGTQGLDAVEGSWSRIPDGTGKFKITAEATPNALNSKTGTDDTTVVQ